MKADPFHHEVYAAFHTKNRLKTVQKIEHNLAYMDYARAFCLQFYWLLVSGVELSNAAASVMILITESVIGSTLTCVLE